MNPEIDIIGGELGKRKRLVFLLKQLPCTNAQAVGKNLIGVQVYIEDRSIIYTEALDDFQAA